MNTIYQLLIDLMGLYLVRRDEVTFHTRDACVKRRQRRRLKQLGFWGRCEPHSGLWGRAPEALAYSANFKP